MAISLGVRKHLADRTASKVRRQIRGRKGIVGTSERPRLVVTRSSRHMVAQVIDDGLGHTLVSASTLEVTLRSGAGDKSAKARGVDMLVAERAKQAGIDKVVFDRAG